MAINFIVYNSSINGRRYTHFNQKGSIWISLALLRCEELTAGMTFCQRRLHSQTKQPCNLVSHFNRVTDKQSVSPDYCDDIVRTRTPPPATNTSIETPRPPPRHTRRAEAFSKFFPDLVRGMSRPLTLANKAAVCLISDCCHGYSKQGERVCVYEQTHLLAGAI